VDDAKTILEKSRADGVMIGRGTYGKPWFLSQVIEFLRGGRRVPDPAIDRQHAILRRHYTDMIAHYGEVGGVRMARKHVGWYTKGLTNSAEFRSRINRIADPREALEAIDAFYGAIMEGQEAA
jgi:tRNA-dihydrouridine synthase B